MVIRAPPAGEAPDAYAAIGASGIERPRSARDVPVRHVLAKTLKMTGMAEREGFDPENSAKWLKEHAVDAIS